jgi:hypothetical protein
MTRDINTRIIDRFGVRRATLGPGKKWKQRIDGKLTTIAHNPTENEIWEIFVRHVDHKVILLEDD